MDTRRAHCMRAGPRRRGRTYATHSRPIRHGRKPLPAVWRLRNRPRDPASCGGMGNQWRCSASRRGCWCGWWRGWGHWCRARICRPRSGAMRCTATSIGDQLLHPTAPSGAGRRRDGPAVHRDRGLTGVPICRDGRSRQCTDGSRAGIPAASRAPRRFRFAAAAAAALLIALADYRLAGGNPHHYEVGVAMARALHDVVF